MIHTKKKLVNLVSAIKEETIIEYLYTFVGLKVYGAVKLPKNIMDDLRQLYDEYLVRQGYELSDFGLDKTDLADSEREPTEEEILAEDYRCIIVETLYRIESPAILNYIRILAEDVAKEDRGSGLDMPSERSKAIRELVGAVVRMKNTAKIRFLIPIVKGYEKGGDKE